jgi:polysaccharide deacetylase family protein (PEP-CTERM system associated)
MKPKAILTFDFEFWYNSKFLKKYIPRPPSSTETSLQRRRGRGRPVDKNESGDYAGESVLPLLDLLDKYKQQATFFVLGRFAKKYPELIKKISCHRHEIASHGYSHRILDELGTGEFEKELLKTNQIIEEITGRRPIGFRAANFSLNKKTEWALEILNKNNFKYDSSVHPLKPFSNSNQILEIPSSIGGIYFRMLPLKLYIFAIKHLSRTDVPIIYFHPYELFDSAPRINSAPWHKRKIKYWGTKNAWDKFQRLMKEFDFISIEQYLNENTSH